MATPTEAVSCVAEDLHEALLLEGNEEGLGELRGPGPDCTAIEVALGDLGAGVPGLLRQLPLGIHDVLGALRP